MDLIPAELRVQIITNILLQPGSDDVVLKDIHNLRLTSKVLSTDVCAALGTEFYDVYHTWLERSKFWQEAKQELTNFERHNQEDVGTSEEWWGLSALEESTGMDEDDAHMRCDLLAWLCIRFVAKQQQYDHLPFVKKYLTKWKKDLEATVVPWQDSDSEWSDVHGSESGIEDQHSSDSDWFDKASVESDDS